MAHQRDYAAEYRRRIERQAAKLGKPAGQLTHAERKQARGHARSEGHRRRQPPEHIPPAPGSKRLPETAVGRDYLRGRDQAPKTEYKNAAVPTPSDLHQALSGIKSDTVVVKIQIIGPPSTVGSFVADVIQWRSAVQGTERLRRQLAALERGEPRSSAENRQVMARLAGDLFGAPGAVMDALRWSFAEGKSDD